MLVNTWLQLYGPKIRNVLLELEKHIMMNTGGGSINLKVISSYLKASYDELNRVTNENIELQKKLNELEKKYPKYKES